MNMVLKAFRKVYQIICNDGMASTDFFDEDIGEKVYKQ